tara:strand:+ start:3673 stop:4386 length:714 start_codon:yes stop_codon:yes gene_type:complete
MVDNWKPNEEELEWTRNIVESMEINQDWMEGEMAFRKTGDATLALLTRTERAEGPAQRVAIVLNELGWDLDESEVKVIPDDPALAAEMMQQQAESWTCPSCDERIVNMDLEKAFWEVQGSTYYVDENGERQPMDRWVVTLECTEGETGSCPVHLSPDDYFLVAGEVNFYTWWFFDADGESWKARIMPPETIVECVDSGTLESLNVKHLGTTFQGNTVPPHMRGTFCLMVKAPIEEEE